jgi:hypothetical protein
MAITDADRLAAEGVALTIAGYPFRVKYTPRSLKLMEDRYGSLQKVFENINAAGAGDAPVIDTIFFVLAMGLRHQKVPDDDTGEAVPVGVDWLLEHGETTQLETYIEALAAALAEALPAPKVEANGESPVDPTIPVQPNGVTSSGWPSSGSDLVSSSSGTA